MVGGIEFRSPVIKSAVVGVTLLRFLCAKAAGVRLALLFCVFGFGAGPSPEWFLMPVVILAIVFIFPFAEAPPPPCARKRKPLPEHKKGEKVWAAAFVFSLAIPIWMGAKKTTTVMNQPPGLERPPFNPQHPFSSCLVFRRL